MAREARGSKARRSGAMLAALGLLAAGAAAAEEPLYLRIRARPDAAAQREAVWERSRIRARALIASVCTGCLRPWADPAPPAPRADGTAHDARLAALSASAGLEADPSLRASEPSPEPPIPERRP